MKKILITLPALLLAFVIYAQNPEKKVTPEQLAGVIVDALEELRDTLKANNLKFETAKLEISATSKFKGGGGLSV